jgi:hypothetical protein
MERYRTLIHTEGNLAEHCMNRGGEFDLVAYSVKRQVALLIALRDAGELKHSKPSEG